MRSAEIKAFLSCSFRKEDQKINNFVKAICNALDIKCVNVNDAYSQTPPDKAKQLLNESKLMIAIATRRKKFEDETYSMPQAIHDEISMAYAMDKPMLLFKEEGVIANGFIDNYGTHMNFFRDKLYDHELMRSFISSIHSIKVESISSKDLIPEIDVGFYNDNLTALFEIIKDGNSFSWKYSSTRKMIFTENFQGIIRSFAMAEIEVKDETKNIMWNCEIIDASSKEFKLNTTIEKESTDTIHLTHSVSPKPESNQYIELLSTFQSRNLNAITKEDVGEPATKVGNKVFHCYDGKILTQRTKKLKLQFRFPRNYAICSNSIFPFVASYTAGIDYIVESEIKRADILFEKLGGNIIVSIYTESPLIGHLYGVAWNFKDK